MNRKIIIGFTHGDTNGMGFELILKTFANPELFEVCIPVVFGSAKILQIHQNTLNLTCNVHVASDISQLRDGVLNLIDITDEAPAMSVDFSHSTDSLHHMDKRSLDALFAAVQAGSIDAIVVTPDDDNSDAASLSPSVVPWHKHFAYLASKLDVAPLVMHSNPHVRIAQIETATNDMLELTSDYLAHSIRLCCQSVRRDFLCSAPRVAVLFSKEHRENEDASIGDADFLLSSVVRSLPERGTPVFGPYNLSRFVAAADFNHFDCLFALNAEQAATVIRTFDTDESVSLLLTPDFICGAVFDASVSHLARIRETAITMLHVIYHIIDICRNRASYDASHDNPLPFIAAHERYRHETNSASVDVPASTSRAQEKSNDL